MVIEDDDDCQSILVVEAGPDAARNRWLCQLCQAKDEPVVFNSTDRFTYLPLATHI